MKNPSSIPGSWLVAAGVLLLVTLWMLSGAMIGSEDPPADEAGAASERDRILVRVEESIARPMTNRLRLTGRTVSSQRVEVRSETSGVVAELGAARGAPVDAGDLLVRLAVEDRRARLLEARSRLAEAESKYEAATRLEQQGFQAQTALIQARAAFDEAKATVLISELELERIRIEAPISGIVNEREVEIGDFVDRGEKLATIVDLDPIRIVGQVSERYLGQIAVGSEGIATTLDGHRHEGSVSYVGRIADETTRTFPVEVEIPNPDRRLIEGITAELSLSVDEIRAHRIAPSALSLADDGTLGIKSVTEEGTVRFHPVEILGDGPGGIWVDGLPERLLLIVAGQAFVQPGQPVEIRRGSGAPETE